MGDSNDSAPLGGDDQGSRLEEPMEVESRADSEEAEQAEDSNGVAEDDPADDAEAELNGQLYLDSPSRQFYENEYVEHEKTQQLSKDGTRGRRRYVASCKRCGKKVCGTDSFWGFRNHCQLRHGECFQKPDGYYGPSFAGSGSKTELVAEDDLVREVITVPKQEPVDGLSLSRPNKEFFERLYYDHAATKGRKRIDGRSIVRYTARCSRCNHSTSGVDSYYSFKDHFRHKHPELVDDLGEAAAAAKSLVDMPGSSEVENGIVSAVSLTAEPLRLDKPAKTFYETLYEDHVILKEEKPDSQRSSTKYSASCRLCNKRVFGTDTFFGFRQHIKNKHKDVQILSCDMAETLSHTAAPPDSVSGSASHPRVFVESGKSSFPPSKHYYREMYRDHESFDIVSEVPGGRKSHRVAACCKTCGKFVTAVDSYHNFRHHYLRQHGNQQQVDGETSEESKARKSFNPGSSAEIVAWSKLSGKNSDQNVLNENVALCLAGTLIPAEQLTKRCFDKLVKSLDEAVAWPTEDSLLEKHLPALQSHVKCQIVAELNEAPAVSVAAYIWPPDGFFAVVARYMDTNWQMQNPVLAARRVRGQQTTNSVFQSVVGVVTEYGISGKIVFVDALCGGAVDSKERKSAGKVAEQDRLLANELKDLLREHYKNDSTVGMVDNVADSLEMILESSVKADALLSTFVKRIVQHPALAKSAKPLTAGTSYNWEVIWERVSAAAECNWDAAKPKISGKLSTKERADVTELLKILQYFEQVFQKLQKTQAAICDVIPILYGLRHSLTKCLDENDTWSSFIQSVLEELDLRFAGADETLPYLTATFLEPSYKLLWCKASRNANKAEDVKDKVYQQMLPFEPEETEPESGESSEPPLKRPALLSFLGDLPGNMPNGRRLNTPVEEMEAYLASDFTHADPLEYWRLNKNRFRRLAHLARSVLCLPVTGYCPAELSRVVGDGTLEGSGDSTEIVGFCHLNIGYAREYGIKRKRLDA